MSTSSGLLCPRCGAKALIQLAPGDVCPDCASAEAWERYGRPGAHLVVDGASITEALARRVGKRRRPWLRAVPCLLAVALSAAALAVIATLLPARGPGPLAPLLAEASAVSRAGIWLGAGGLVAGVLGIAFLRRSSLGRVWPLTACAVTGIAAGLAAAAFGALQMQRASSLKEWRHLSMPPRSAAHAQIPEIDRIMGATVVLLAPDADGSARWPAIGTGSVILAEDARAWVVTCSHVAMPYAATAATRRAADAHPVWVCFADGREAEGFVRWTGPPPLDVALVSVEIADPPGPIDVSRDAADVTERSQVLFVPNPLRNGWLLHRGTVSARRAHLTPAGLYSLVITDLPVEPGDSGSGLFDAQHRLVGLNTWKAFDVNGTAGISLPSETIRSMLDLIERGQLGTLERRQ
ncbi:MAG: serine protease [Planctomycetota bacterium]